jgi:hypothetical protein
MLGLICFIRIFKIKIKIRDFAKHNTIYVKIAYSLKLIHIEKVKVYFLYFLNKRDFKAYLLIKMHATSF